MVTLHLAETVKNLNIEHLLANYFTSDLSLPSGNIAIENCHLFIVSFPIFNGDFPYFPISYVNVYQKD